MMSSSSAVILYADAREDERAAVTRLLRDAKFVVRPAGTSGEALAEGANRPDLILLHTDLPPLGGLEVCRRLKADPLLASVPVVFYSAGFADAAVRLEALAAGADDYLLESAPPEELIAHLRAVLSLTPPRPYEKPHAKLAPSHQRVGKRAAGRTRPSP